MGRSQPRPLADALQCQQSVTRPPFAISIGWSELLKRTFREFNEDDCLNLAAQLAYYYFLALFPAVLFLIALASFFPLTHVTDDVVRMLSPVTPPDVLSFLNEQMRRISNADSGGILTVGILGAVWSSSAALVAIINSLNRAYDIEETRPWWKVRLLAMGLTLALAFLLLTSFTLVLAGPTLAEYLTNLFGLGAVFEWGWKVLQWPLVFAMVAAAIELVYYVAPDARQQWAWVTPGALVATFVWLAASLGFKVYLALFADYNATYGAVGGVIALLLWFYISGVAILIGAEMNAEIEHASPHGKAPGERVPPAESVPLTTLQPPVRPFEPVQERSVMSDSYRDATLGEMLAGLSRDIKTLFQQELQLARVELTQKAMTMRTGAILIAVGGMLAYGGFLAVIAAIVFGFVAAGVPYWLAALIAGVALAGIGLGCIYSGTAGFRRTTLTPRHTVDSLKEDAKWLKSQAR